MINNPIIFYPTALLIIIFALITLFSKNVVYSLLSAMVVFYSTSLVFYLLGSEYNAIIQVAVYGLAVPIIIGLSIMFCSKNNKEKPEKHFYIPYMTILSGGIFILAFSYLVMMSLVMQSNNLHLMEINSINFYSVMETFSTGLFKNYVWAFEIVSLLLTIVIAGIVLIQYKKGKIWK